MLVSFPSMKKKKWLLVFPDTALGLDPLEGGGNQLEDKLGPCPINNNRAWAYLCEVDLFTLLKVLKALDKAPLIHCFLTTLCWIFSVICIVDRIGSCLC